MKFVVEYFGLLIFAFVILVGGLVALPTLTPAPQTSVREIMGLGLAFVVITGGFSWYYFASSPADLAGGEPSEPRSTRNGPQR
jgi:drug/metabolite transporter (DMT)-like permease